MKHGEAQILKVGDKYGYDYFANVFSENIWLNTAFDFGNFKMNLALDGGMTSFYREGVVRKGLFPGLNSRGDEYVVDGKVLNPNSFYLITKKAN
jgi:hypothetical protein